MKRPTTGMGETELETKKREHGNKNENARSPPAAGFFITGTVESGYGDITTVRPSIETRVENQWCNDQQRNRRGKASRCW